MCIFINCNSTIFNLINTYLMLHTLNNMFIISLYCILLCIIVKHCQSSHCIGRCYSKSMNYIQCCIILHQYYLNSYDKPVSKWISIKWVLLFFIMYQVCVIYLHLFTFITSYSKPSAFLCVLYAISRHFFCK